MKKKTVGILLNTSWNAINFRSGLIESLIKSKFDVIVIAPDSKFEKHILAMGARFQKVVMRPQSKNIMSEFRCVLSILAVIVRLRPDILLTFTIKPNLYGGLVALITRTPYIINIAGLGSSFSEKSVLKNVVSLAYRMVTRRATKVFVQNQEDATWLLRTGICPESLIDVLPGSGVDLDFYSSKPLPERSKIRFLFVGRLLLEKGIEEYLMAAEKMVNERSDVEFCVLGFLEDGDPAYINRSKLEQYCGRSDRIIYVGAAEDVRDSLAASHCVVLPSYYLEGTPRALLEAAAMARPIITTNSIGCRDAVVHGSTGLLCEPRSLPDLIAAMCRMADFDIDELSSMGQSGRLRMESLFDERFVVSKYDEVIRNYLLR